MLASAIHLPESAVGIHVSPPFEPPSCLLPIPPLCLVRECWIWAPSVLTVDSHWLSILHTVISMVLGHSLSPSHPLLLPLCAKVCWLCLCFHCCPSYKFINTIFLDSIYIYGMIYSICFSRTEAFKFPYVCLINFFLKLKCSWVTILCQF